MAVRFVLGRAGTGKTHHCLSAIADGLHDADSASPLLLLVPEQSTLQMEQALVRRCARGGFMRARVLSFSSLANLVYEETGRPEHVISAAARRFALRMLLQRVEAAPTVFARVIGARGFLETVDAALLQFQRGDLGPSDVLALAAREPDAALSAKLTFLADVYARYAEWLGNQRLDTPAEQRLLAARIREIDWLRSARLWIDGFAGFTALELAALVELCRSTVQAEITLLLDPLAPPSLASQAARSNLPESIFEPIFETKLELERRFRNADVPILAPLHLSPRTPPRFVNAAPLASVESRLCAAADDARPPPPHNVASADSLRLLRCQTPRDEIRAAAREIRARVSTSHGATRFSDFALMSRDLGQTAALVREVFAEYDIPHFLDQRRSLSAHPLARALTALFEAALRDLPPEPVIALLQTGLTRAPRDAAEHLERVIRRHSVRGRELWLSRFAWDFDTPQGSRAHANDESADNDASGDDSPRAAAEDAAGDSLADARFDLLSAIDELLAPHVAGDCLTGREWAARLHSALHRLGAPQALAGWAAEAESAGEFEARDQHRAAWGALLEILQDLHDVLGEEPAALATVAELVNDAIRSRTFALAPPTTDQVLVSAIDRSRHPELKYAYLIGVNDGVFPQPAASGGLFSLDEAARLADAGVAGFSPAARHSADERLLFYIATTRASTELTISYSRVNAGGDDAAPSRWLRELGIGASAPPSAIDAPITLRELARAVLTVEAHDPRRRITQQLCERAAESAAQESRLREMLAGTAYDNRPLALGNFRRASDEPPHVVWRASPTEIESWLRCPFRHFARYGLRLSEPAAPRPMHLDLGEALHAILAAALAEGIAAEDWTSWLEYDWRESLDAAARRWVRQLPASLKTRRPDWWHRASNISRLVMPKFASIVDALRRGGFRAAHIEARFGRRDERSILLPLAPGRFVALKGAIDRIDLDCESNPPLLVIHDYKSTAKSLGHRFLLGERLQVFLYGLAAQAFAPPTAEHADEDETAALAGVFLSPLFPDLDAAESEYFKKNTLHQPGYLYRPFGAFTERAAFALDHSLSHDLPSPVARMKLKKPTRKEPDPGFNKNESRDVLNPADFARRLAQARETLALAAEGVDAGDISIAPLVVDRVRACKNCEFGHVCRFEPQRNPSRPAEGNLPVFQPASPKPSPDAAP